MGLKVGYQQTDVGVIPHEWRVRRLDDLLDFRNGVNADRRAYGQGRAFINVLEVIKHTHLLDAEIPGRITLPDAVARTFAVRPGDILFNRTSETHEEVGLASTYVGANHDVVFGGFTIRGRPKGIDLDPVYSGYALRTPVVRSQIIARGQGAIHVNIGQRTLSQVAVPLPPAPEQRAISIALSDVDALMAALDRLVAKKRDIKQAAMQQLLTGKRRLPGFGRAKPCKETAAGTIPEDWGISTVGQEFEIQLGKMLDAEKNRGVMKPYLGNRAIQWNRIDLGDLPRIAMTRSDLARYRLRRGDLLVCEGGEVGRAVIWDAPIEECYYQKALHRLRPIRGFDARLMLAFLRHWANRGVFANYITQTSIAHLPKEKFAQIPLPVPCPEEQQAIASVFSDMDAEIAALERRGDKIRLLKQGMMQELLTGRIRLV